MGFFWVKEFSGNSLKILYLYLLVVNIRIMEGFRFCGLLDMSKVVILKDSYSCVLFFLGL